ncbi:hypothetical protein Q1695_000887 [Nippostrongylus brasiliensis]|nr:hypothetical protein Q1695_000887 [Nippostrongylus brasiliensis]
MGYLLQSGLSLMLFTSVLSMELRYQPERKRFDIDVEKRLEKSDLEGLDGILMVKETKEPIATVETTTEMQEQNFTTSDFIKKRFDPFEKRLNPYNKRFEPFLHRFIPYEKRFEPFLHSSNPHQKRFDPLSKRFDPYSKRFNPYDKRFDPFVKRFDSIRGQVDKSDIRGKRFEIYTKRFEPYAYMASSLRGRFELPSDVVAKRYYEPDFLEQYWGQLNAKRNIFDPHAYNVGFGR